MENENNDKDVKKIDDYDGIENAEQQQQREDQSTNLPGTLFRNTCLDCFVHQSQKSTDQDCSSPANRPNPARSGFSHGSASNAFATSCAAGEKYAITSQCKRPSDSGRVNTAISGGIPAALKTRRNASSISAEGVRAI